MQKVDIDNLKYLDKLQQIDYLINELGYMEDDAILLIYNS